MCVAGVRRREEEEGSDWLTTVASGGSGIRREKGTRNAHCAAVSCGQLISICVTGGPVLVLWNKSGLLSSTPLPRRRAHNRSTSIASLPSPSSLYEWFYTLYFRRCTPGSSNGTPEALLSLVWRTKATATWSRLVRLS